MIDLLEPCAVKAASTVLRGEGGSNAPDLPDPEAQADTTHLYPFQAAARKDTGSNRNVSICPSLHASKIGSF